MIISSKIKALLNVASKDEKRDILNGVFVKDNIAVATDGKVLFQLTDNNLGQLDLFEQEKYKNLYEKPVTLKAETVEKIFKMKLSKKEDKENRPLIIRESIEELGYIDCIVPGLENEEVVIKQKLFTEQYPSYEKIMMQADGKPIFKVALNFRLLASICKMMEQLKPTSSELYFTFFEDFDGVEITYNAAEIDLRGILMPMRGDKDSKDNVSESDGSQGLPDGHELKGTKLDPQNKEGEDSNE